MTDLETITEFKCAIEEQCDNLRYAVSEYELNVDTMCDMEQGAIEDLRDAVMLIEKALEKLDITIAEGE